MDTPTRTLAEDIQALLNVGHSLERATVEDRNRNAGKSPLIRYLM